MVSFLLTIVLFEKDNYLFRQQEKFLEESSILSGTSIGEHR